MLARILSDCSVISSAPRAAVKFWFALVFAGVSPGSRLVGKAARLALPGGNCNCVAEEDWRGWLRFRLSAPGGLNFLPPQVVGTSVRYLRSRSGGCLHWLSEAWKASGAVAA